MHELMENINFKIDTCQYSELGMEWNTIKFNLINPVTPFARLYYPLEGSGKVVINDKTFDLRPGRIYLIQPYAPALVSCQERLVKYWCHFNAFILESDLDIFTVTQPAVELEVEEPEFSSALFRKLIKAHSIVQNRHDPLMEMECRSALSLLLMPFLKTVKDKGQEFSANPSLKLGRLLAYIELHLTEGLNLEKLAETANLNPTYLSNMFAHEIGMPLIRYCNERRIRRAMDLMWNSDYSFAEIAYRTGAENVSAFSRLFKRHIGISPQEFKRKIRNNLKVQS